MTAPLTPAEIASMLADADLFELPGTAFRVSAYTLSRYVRALAAECERLRASRPEWVKCRQEQIEAVREAESLRAECEQWKQTLMDTLTGYNEDRLALNHPLRLELTETRAKLEAVTRERDRYKAALEYIVEHVQPGVAVNIAREALKGAG